MAAASGSMTDVPNKSSRIILKALKHGIFTSALAFHENQRPSLLATLRRRMVGSSQQNLKIWSYRMQFMEVYK
jgi:hypothetical protein